MERTSGSDREIGEVESRTSLASVTPGLARTSDGIPDRDSGPGKIAFNQTSRKTEVGWRLVMCKERRYVWEPPRAARARGGGEKTRIDFSRRFRDPEE